MNCRRQGGRKGRGGGRRPRPLWPLKDKICVADDSDLQGVGEEMGREWERDLLHQSRWQDFYYQPTVRVRSSH